MWREVTQSVWLFEDSCNVYAVRGPEGIVLINAGTGLWLDHMNELPGKVKALLCTHFFRDHTAGAVAVKLMRSLLHRTSISRSDTGSSLSYMPDR